MHHKHDVSSKDVFSITDMAAGIFFWKFCTISKEAAKRYILPPQITFSSSSLFLLIRLRLPSPGWDGKLWLKRRKNEEKEKVKWGDKMCLFAYDAKFSTKNPSSHIYDIKGIFWAYIMFMVHIPFNGWIALYCWIAVNTLWKYLIYKQIIETEETLSDIYLQWKEL